MGFSHLGGLGERSTPTCVPINLLQSYSKTNTMGLPAALKAWNEHLNAYMKAHPNLSRKQAMIGAKPSYHKKHPSKGSKSRKAGAKRSRRATRRAKRS